MKNVVSRFEERIKRINLIYGLIIPLVANLVLSTVISIHHHDYFQTGNLANYSYVLLTIVIFITATIQVLARKRLTLKQLGYMYASYHVVFAMISIFVDPYPSPFAYMWLVILVAVDVLFGKRWQQLSILFYIATYTVAFIHSDTPVTLLNVIIGFVYLAGFIIIALQVSKYRQVSDDERIVLDEASRSSAFERQRLLSLINNMGEAVIATDQNGKILLYNAAVLDLLDTNVSLDNKSLGSVLNLHDSKQHKVNALELLQSHPHGLTSTDYTHQFQPHDRINMYLNIAPIKLGFKQKSGSGFIIMMRDVTKEKSLEEERDEFISVISHELRTPVAIAEGNISNAIFMSDKKHAPKMIGQALDQAHDQVLFLASMINDLSTLSRAERTDVALELSQVDPRDLVHSLSRDYETQANLKGLSLTASAAEDTKPITTAELYLHEILQNFLTNAIKYTKKGSVILHVRSNQAGDAIFSVADSGIGLSKSDQKRVFDKFFRSEDYRTRESSGTGLGLYVTAKLAHRLNATIELDSELNKGTTFTITVPNLKQVKRLTKPAA